MGRHKPPKIARIQQVALHGHVRRPSGGIATRRGSGLAPPPPPQGWPTARHRPSHPPGRDHARARRMHQRGPHHPAPNVCHRRRPGAGRNRDHASPSGATTADHPPSPRRRPPATDLLLAWATNGEHPTEWCRTVGDVRRRTAELSRQPKVAHGLNRPSSAPRRPKSPRFGWSA